MVAATPADLALAAAAAPAAGRTLLAAAAMVLWSIVVIRVVGLRSLSKMSAFDFVVTVALGSLTATTVATSTPLWRGALGVAALLAVQWVIARARSSARLAGLVDNRPLLLVRDGRVLDENLRRARLTTDDLRSKLRGAGVGRLADARAVVFETTGDVSVLAGDQAVEDWMLDGVRGAGGDASWDGRRT